MHLAAAIAVIAVFLVSLYGWGRPLARALPTGAPPNHHGWAFTALLGLVAWAFMGGILILFGWVGTTLLDALVLIGLALAGIGPLRHRPGLPPLNRATLKAAVPVLVVWGGALYMAANLLPTRAFNYADDQQKYLVRPLQLLAEGHFGNNPFDTLGYHSLGLQSFFHAFTVGHFSPLYLNAFDQVFCYLLAGLLLNELGRRAGAGPGVRTVAVITMMMVDPQWVNISAAYSGTLLVVGLACIGLYLLDTPFAHRRDALAAGLILGGMVATLAALKATMVPYALGFTGLLLVMIRLTGTPDRRPGAVALGEVGGATLLILPWMMGGAYNYLTTVTGLIRRSLYNLPRLASAAPNGPAAAPAPAAQAVEPHAAPTLPDRFAALFSSQGTYNGHHFIDYGAVVLLALLCAGIALWLMRRQGNERHPGLVIVMIASLTAAGFYLLIPATFTIAYKGVRYLCPILVPLLPICAVLIAAAVGRRATPRTRQAVTLVAVVSLLVVCALFAKSAVARMQQIRVQHSALSFPLGPFNFTQHYYAFSPENRQRTRQIQGLTTPGSGLLTLITTPFVLDFSRNHILNMPEADFSAHNLGLLASHGPKALRQRLMALGVDYVLWEHTTPNMGQQQRRLLDPMRERERLTINAKLAELLADSIAERRALFDDGRTALFSLRPIRPPMGR